MHVHASAELQAQGPWPFVTLKRERWDGHILVWRARSHRKGLERLARGLSEADVPPWQTAGYNRIIGALFALGSVLFMAGSALALVNAAFGWPSGRVINITFFLGSIPFTTAAAMQHFQAANAGDLAARTGERIRAGIKIVGWQPRSAGWQSTFTQLLGTLAFNINTFDAIDPPAAAAMQDLVIWLPGLVGSVLFLVSGALAYVEAGHAYFSWRPGELGWRIAFVNLIGCIAFMTAGILSFVPTGPEPGWIAAAAFAHLGIGAFCFFVGAVLMMRESRLAG